MTQQELVGRRLGQSNGKVRAAAEEYLGEVEAAMRALSTPLAFAPAGRAAAASHAAMHSAHGQSISLSDSIDHAWIYA